MQRKEFGLTVSELEVINLHAKKNSSSRIFLTQKLAEILLAFMAPGFLQMESL